MCKPDEARQKHHNREWDVVGGQFHKLMCPSYPSDIAKYASELQAGTVSHVVERGSDNRRKKLNGVANPEEFRPLYCDVVAVTLEEKAATEGIF